jgi:hypothetical protein
VSERSRAEKIKLIRASTANLEYFFSRLDASWLPFLLEEGFFSNPLPPETGTTKDGQTWIRFPNWPESQFLARIAGDDPERVLVAIERIPATANPRVHQDIVTAASALPGELAARVAESEQSWLANYEGHLVSYPRPAGELIAHLAKEGQLPAAFQLAGTVLKIFAAPEDESRTARRRAVARTGDWEYAEILESAWPSMMEADPEKAFCFLCYRLAEAIEFGIPEDSDFDPSYIWRSAIEDHAQNTGNSLLDTLVDAIRDIALTHAARDSGSKDMVLAELARHDRALFRRLSLFVLARFGSSEQVTTALADEKSIDDVNVWHEYAELLRLRFGDLDSAEQRSILALIAAGPDRELTAAHEERGFTEEELETRRRYWRLERYALIAEHLDGDAMSEYESLMAEFGKPDHPTFHSVVTSWAGPASPYSAEELLEMGPAGALEALRTWEPEGGPEDPSPEGLGRILEAAVEKDPSGFAEIATEFADLDPDYVRGLLGGLAKAAREKKPFPWGPVLGLCERVVAAEPLRDDGDTEAPRNWLRRTSVSLLSDGLSESEAEIPSSERTRVWRIIEACLEDPDPSPDRDGGQEPATVAINSVRGEALHAAVRYALWVERALGAESAFEGTASLPEFAAALDARLDLSIERSLAIRAVLGQWFVQFVRMDRQWAESLVPRLFPTEPDAASFFSAAWNAYVVFNRAYVEIFEILRESYDLAVERFEEIDEDRYMAGSPREHLAEHLFYLRFNDSVDLTPDGLFERFWRVAPVEIRKHSIRDVGWSLGQSNATLSDDFRARIVETWEWIFDRGAEGEQESLREFGAWFGARQFEDSWLLAQGGRILDLGVSLEPDHVVYKALPRMAGEHSREVVETLRLMIATDAEGWSVLGSVDEVRETLATVLGSANESARSDAVVVLNLLGARGMSEFRDLMPSGS